MDPKLAGIIFNSISDGVFTVDQNCIITSFNKAAEEITGFSAKTAVGQHCFDIFRTEVCHKQCALRDTLAKHTRVDKVRVTIITEDGCEVPIQVSTTLLRDDHDKIIGAVEFFNDLTEVEHLKRRVDKHSAIHDIVSNSPIMGRLINTLPDIAESECNVLIQGPSGSGKELFAEAIHGASPRRYGPYVKLNCAALPANLLESELFGYVKGAFTDAKRDKPGHFCFASGGTLLLDEIAEMDIALQVKLLRVLNNGEYQPLGSNHTLRANVRIIAATNANLKAAIEAGQFREDLYFRLNVVGIELPALHERPEDIPILVNHFIKQFSKRGARPIRDISPEALAVLRRYTFPGNVRELENAIEHAFVMCHDQTIDVEHLPANIVEQAELGGGPIMSQKSEKQIIEESLQRHHGNRSLVAKELGMHRTTLWRKLKTLRIAC